MDNNNSLGTIKISRNLYTLDDYNKKYQQMRRKQTLTELVKDKCTTKRTVELLTSYLPILRIVRKYNLRENLVTDILAGLTVSFIHLPQGLAFGLLASLQPIYGLYTTFFPVLFYMIFGTSPYVSYGPTANMAILTRMVVEREAKLFKDQYEHFKNASLNSSNFEPTETEIVQVKVGTAAACSVISGLFLGIFGFFRLGFLTSYLSTSFIGGFTTASAVFVASSQVKKLFGLTTESYSGIGGLILSYIDLFRKLGDSKVPEIVISVISITILLTVKIGINERYKDKLKVPIPIDFIIVVLATVTSYFAKFEENFDVFTVGPIPSGFLPPALPKLDNASNYIADSIVIATVSLGMTITFAKMTAKKYGNEVNESQELFAYGVSNILSGFFGCYPAANASSRTGILTSLGAKSTLNGCATILVFLLIILLAGQLLVYLPMAVLASMILISTKHPVLQYKKLPRIWRINKVDFIIWVVTNLSSLLLDLYHGLIIGLFVSILLVVVQSQTGSGYLLKVAQSEDVLHRVDSTTDIGESDLIKIFKFPVNIYYATAERFKRQLYDVTFNPDAYRKKQKRLQRKINGEAKCVINTKSTDSEAHHIDEALNTAKMKAKDLYKPYCIILDCSMISYMDIAGACMLQDVITEYHKLDIKVFLSGLGEQPFGVLNNFELFSVFPKTNVFLDVFDAIEISKRQFHSTSQL